MSAKLKIIPIISCFLPLFFSCKAKAPQSQIILTMAEVNPDTSISGQMDAVFKQKVEELSKGQIKINLVYFGILGDEEHILDLMTGANSSVQIARTSTFSIAKRGADKTSLLSIPYTFKNKEHFWNFARSPLAEDFLTEPYKKGLKLRGLFFSEEGFRNFFGVQPINSVEDLKGQTVRISVDSNMADASIAFGAYPITLPFSDVYTALQTGKCSAAEQPVTNYKENFFGKVARYMIRDEHTLGITEVVITANVWDILTKEQREVLLTAGRYASEHCKRISEITEEKALEELRNDRCVITDVPDKEPWKKACDTTIKKAAGKYPKLYQQIIDMAQ